MQTQRSSARPIAAPPAASITSKTEHLAALGARLLELAIADPGSPEARVLAHLMTEQRSAPAPQNGPVSPEQAGQAAERLLEVTKREEPPKNSFGMAGLSEADARFMASFGPHQDFMVYRRNGRY